jgi:hypothetical protein
MSMLNTNIQEMKINYLLVVYYCITVSLSVAAIQNQRMSITLKMYEILSKEQKTDLGKKLIPL